MYRHGLGDCFLLAFGAGNGRQRYVLIDFGVLVGTPEAEERMTAVARDIIDATGGRLDAIAVTHEHWDHVSGFLQAQDEMKNLQVDQLWLAWTEDPRNALAKKLRERKKQALAAIRAAFEGPTDPQSSWEEERARQHKEFASSSYGMRVQEVASFFGDLLGAKGTTEDALAWAKKQWTNHVYCTPGMDPLGWDDAPNVSFYVLGPPEDRKMLWKSRASKKQSETYLEDLGSEGFGAFQAALNQDDVARERCQPFSEPYCLQPDDWEVADMAAMYGEEEWRRIDSNWLEAASELALKLDSHTNNTSLVLAVELSVGGKVLLFPGDAQIGNWLSWEDVSWSVAGGGAPLSAWELVERTVLYKVGHHGSHNATLSDKGLELMAHPDLTAMIPVDRATARKRKWRMPHEPLYDRLTELTSGRVILADEGISAADIDNKYHGAATASELYIDLEIEP